MVKKIEKINSNLYVIQQYFGHVITYDCNIRKKNEVSLISNFGISRITLQLYHTKIKILV